MAQHKVIMIVPRMVPSVDGVGDYAFTLAKALKNRYAIDTHFFVCDPSWVPGTEDLGFRITKLPERSNKALATLLGAHCDEMTSVLLHYVGYGYARRGCPDWLIKGLQSFRSRHRAKITTMFHELYAFGPIWTSQFWTSPWQRHLFKNLVALSDRHLTSLERYASKIQSLLGSADSVRFLPVFSNIGEPQARTQLPERKKQLVVFGSRGPRSRVYLHPESLELVCRNLNISQIIDIGSKLPQLPRISGVKLIEMGVLPNSEVSRLMSESVAGFINYPEAYLSKSGIMAAYSSHGLLPILINNGQRSTDLLPLKHFIYAIPDHVGLSIDQLDDISSTVYSWYGEHQLSKHAEEFHRLLI